MMGGKKLKRIFSKKKKGYIIATMLLVSTLTLTACSSEVKQEEIVAKVNNQPITKQELYDAMVNKTGEDMLYSLVTQKVIDSELEKSKLTVTNEEVDAEYNRVMSNYQSEAVFLEALNYYGYTTETFRAELLNNLKIKKLLEPSITITEEDIAAYFEANQESFAQPEQVRASHILVKDEADAKSIHEKIVAGGDFAELAKEHSIDGSKDAGGDLGFFGKGMMVAPFEDAAFSLTVGEVSELVQSEFGYHIIKVTDKKEAKAANLEESKENIKNILLEQEIPNVYEEWFASKLKENKVEYYLD